MIDTPKMPPNGALAQDPIRSPISPEAAFFFASVAASRMPMVVSDPRLPDNPIIFTNDAFLEMTGYRRDEVLDRNCRFLQGPDTDRGAVRELARAIAARENVATEIVNYRKDGTPFWNALFVSPIYDAGGTLVYFFASQLDVSRRRDAEEALGQAQKMEALGQLTGGIAHDFNNLLQVILGNLEIVRGKLGEQPRLQERVERAAWAAQRGATLTSQLLAFARKQPLAPAAIDLSAAMPDLVPLLRRTLGEHIEVRYIESASLWPAMADPADVRRVTGYVLGGVSPLGQRKRLPTAIDESALRFETVFCSAGRRGLEVEVAPSDLVAATSATVAPLAAP